MPRYRLTIEYDGTHLNGWQRQQEGLSVQAVLEEAVQRFCGEQPMVCGSGRTDAGVHARAQVAHLDLSKEVDPFKLMSAMNYYLKTYHQLHPELTFPVRVSVLEAQQVDEAFHARFSAKARHYRYRILNRRAPLALDYGKAWNVPEKLDADAMQDAASVLLGHHDFTSFRDTMCQAKSPLKTLDALTVKHQDGDIRIYVSARSFLHHQVRIIVGSLKLVGNGHWTKQDLQNALEAKDRKAAGPTAPADGLCLMHVEY